MKKDSFLAKISFILSLFSWIPLLNIGISLIALWLSVKSIKLYLKDKNRYGGFFYAIVAFILSSSMFIASIIVFVIYIRKKLTCDVVQCSNLF